MNRCVVILSPFLFSEASTDPQDIKEILMNAVHFGGVFVGVECV